MQTNADLELPALPAEAEVCIFCTIHLHNGSKVQSRGQYLMVEMLSRSPQTPWVPSSLGGLARSLHGQQPLTPALPGPPVWKGSHDGVGFAATVHTTVPCPHHRALSTAPWLSTPPCVVHTTVRCPQHHTLPSSYL